MRWLILIGLVMWVATCGQKGPLQLPANDAAAAVSCHANWAASVS